MREPVLEAVVLHSKLNSVSHIEAKPAFRQHIFKVSWMSAVDVEGEATSWQMEVASFVD
jgi:hypothetical protein